MRHPFHTKTPDKNWMILISPIFPVHFSPVIWTCCRKSYPNYNQMRRRELETFGVDFEEPAETRFGYNLSRIVGAG